jgi:hypothetical protein
VTTKTAVPVVYVAVEAATYTAGTAVFVVTVLLLTVRPGIPGRR